jgi:anti-sigma factor RsiW
VTDSRKLAEDALEAVLKALAERDAALACSAMWRAERDRLREAIASALTSLATGPGKDDYAYQVLDAALEEK